jgi:hypothetical protein
MMHDDEDFNDTKISVHEVRFRVLECVMAD